MKYFRYIFLLFAISCVAACVENYQHDLPVEGDLPVVFTQVPVQQISPGIRSVSADVQEDVAISDFWVFQYNSNGSFIGKPKYYRGSASASIIRPSANEGAYTVVFIANTHDNSFHERIDYSTLSSLKATGMAVQSSSDLFQKGYNDLILNGKVSVYSTTSEINCQLYRNVAKLVVNVVNNASDITIRSLQLKNVNTKLFYADRLYDGDDRNGTVAVPSHSAVNFDDFELDEVMVAPNDSKTLSYYLPRNMRGKVDNPNQEDKNTLAPAYATYLEVMAVRHGLNMPVRYRFYLGKDNSGDFNIEPNYLYNITLTFNDVGESDSRTEDMGVYDFSAREGEANSYIVNPVSANVGRRYVIKAADRINAFWSSPAGKQSTKWEQNCLGGKAWVAEVIWQDIADKQVIRFCQEDGALSDQYSGTADDTSFSFVLTDAAVGSYGNILIGVRNGDSQDYLWSWHIWLTDYQPYTNVGEWMDGVYKYQVEGGYLHKYPCMADIMVDGQLIYDGRYVMDRNLGAVGTSYPLPVSSTAERNDLIAQAAGMYYIYGRKDPFPGQKTYDIEGNLKNNVMTTEKGPGYIYQSVNKPVNYYVTESSFSSGEDWAASNEWRQNDWNDINVPASSGGKGKSFFDPCPPGWKLPRAEILDSFGGAKYVYAANCFSWIDLGLNEFSSYGGCVIYLAGEVAWNKRSGDVTFYPAGGHRKYEDGALTGIGWTGTMWTVLPAARSDSGVLYWDRGYYLYYQNSLESNGLLFSHPRGFHRYLGMPVRCVQE